MRDKEQQSKHVVTSHYSDNDTIPECAEAEVTQTEYIAENEPTTLSPTPKDDSSLEKYEERCAKVKMELKKARLRKDNLQKQRQFLEEELLAHEAVLDAEIELILNELRSTEDFESLDDWTFYKTGNNVNKLGLKQLSSLSAVIIQPRRMVSKTEKAYRITTDTGGPLLKILDQEHKFTLSGQTNEFQFDIYDSLHQKVISVCSKSKNHIHVKILDDLVSTVKKQSSFWTKSSIYVTDGMENPILQIIESRNEQYYIYNMKKQRIGLMTRWSSKNCSTYRIKPYLIEFPVNLGVNIKAAIIAAHLFIQFPYGL